MRILVDACGKRITSVYLKSEGKTEFFGADETFASYGKNEFLPCLWRILGEILRGKPRLECILALCPVEVLVYSYEREAFSQEEYNGTNVVFSDIEALVPVYAAERRLAEGSLNYVCELPNGAKKIYDSATGAFVSLGRAHAGNGGFSLFVGGDIHKCSARDIAEAYLRKTEARYGKGSNKLLEKYGMFGAEIYVSEGSSYEVYFTESAKWSAPLLEFFRKNRLLVFYDSVYFERTYGITEPKSFQERFFGGVRDAEFFPVVTYAGAGERKDAGTVKEIIDRMAESRASRDTCAVAMGGGVLTDAVGSAAAMYKRGIRFIKIPTTLIGQVDAGIGIKVGFNYGGKKNLLGYFYPAEIVINVLEFARLSGRKKIECGLAEIFKTAMICDFKILERLEALGGGFFEKITGGEEGARKACFEIIEMAAFSILNLLKDNQYERGSTRRYFDFGHSFSGFLEKKGISHGYAVAAEMLFCTVFSHDNGFITEDYYRYILKLFAEYGIVKSEHLRVLLENYAEIRNSFIASALAKRDGDLNFVVPAGKGSAGFLNLEGCRDKSANYLAVWSEAEFCERLDSARRILSDLAYIFE